MSAAHTLTPICAWLLPEGLPPVVHEADAIEDRTRQHIESSLLTLNALEQRCHVSLIATVGTHGNPLSTTRSDFLSSIFYCSWGSVRRLGTAASRTCSDVYCCAGISERQGDPATRSAACARHYGDLPCKLLFHVEPPGHRLRIITPRP